MSFPQERRTFRGRGGPTDKRLPKNFNATRRRKVKHVNKYAEANESQAKEQKRKDEDEEDGSMEIEVEPVVVPEKEEELEPPPPFVKDIEHLTKRVRNVRQSFSLSPRTIDPMVYETNVIAATRNCLIEYASIRKHYELPEQLRREIGQQLFEIVQQALQTGPLFGAKPGYFKRCGSEIATLVLAFLQGHEWTEFDLTEKQVQAIAKWKENATKATNDDKPPSKTVVKKQHDAKKKSKGK